MDQQPKKTVSAFIPKVGKWFWAFAATGVLLIGAIVAILVLTVGSKKTPDAPLPQEGSETGIYYFDAASGEYTLALNSGCKFTIAGPDLNKSGDYTVDGSAVTLDFVRDEDGTAQATLDGNRLVLVWQDATLNFLRKVSFTVSFETNGGAALDAASVINGKTVAKPADPVRDGNVFLGWYADPALTQAFHFGSTPVYGDTTVFAKWAEKVPGQDEYAVGFDLGYETAVPASVTTVGGKLVFTSDYTEPVREGYTFAGWYISDYEDGSRLTRSAAEGTVLHADTTLFAVWEQVSSDQLSAPEVSVEGNTISWNAVDGANAYQVTVTDGVGNVLFDQSVGTTTQSFDFASSDAGDYIVKVIAKGSAKGDSVAAERYCLNKALNRVSGLRVIGSTLVFDAVDGAEKYLITVDCGNKAHTHTLFDNGKSTYYNFENCTMQPSGISFTVTAVADGYASSQSKPLVLIRNLGQVGEIAYDAETATFRWTGVPDAVKYLVTVTCGGKTETFDNGSATAISVKSLTGDVSVSVVPVSAGYNSPEGKTLAVTKMSPATPEHIVLSEMTLSWNAAAGAKSYIVRVNGTSFPVSGTSFGLRDAGLSFLAGAQYDVTVQAVGETENSVISDPLKATYLSMGTLSYDANTVSWSPVIGISRFEVRVNGGESFFVTGANAAKIVLTKSGINTVEVRTANFATDTEWAQLEVMAYRVTYESRSLGGSVTEYVAKGDTMALPTGFLSAGFDFDGWYNTPSAAAGNGAGFAGSVFDGNGDTVLYANWTPKSYSIEIIGVDSSMSGAATGDKTGVTYTKNYTLPVMTTTDTVKGNFAGWYTGPGGTGTKLTDYLGNSVGAYNVTTDSLAYPYFTSGLVFERKNDNTYAVKKGADIDTIPKVTIPASYNGIAVTSILENGFYDCDSLVEINIPDTIALIGTGAFGSCDALEALNVYPVKTDTPHEVFYHSYDGALLYDDAASGYTYLEVFPRAKKGTFTVTDAVDVIRSRAFNYAKISAVTISKDVLIVGDYAFSNCRSLKSIVFEGGRTLPVSVSSGSFVGCYAVTEITLPALIKGPGEDDAFDVKTLNTLTSLETVSVERVTGAYFSSVDGMLCNDLGDTVLYCPLGYTGISGILTVPKGITAIGDGTFSGRTAFTEVVIPNYVTKIGANAFYGCRSLTKITFEGSRSRDLTVGDAAFFGCTNAKEILLAGNNGSAPDAGSVSIGAYVFSGISELRTLKVGAGVNISEIGTAAFEADQKLRTIDVSASATVTRIGDRAFRGCEGLIAFTIPASTVAVGDSAFSDCAFLAKVVFAPNGQNIDFGSYVFRNCVALTSVELPATVQSFDGSAFDGCSSLRTIVVDAANPYLTTENGILYNKSMTEIMFYPKGINDPTLAQLPWETLTVIGNTVFKNNANLTSVTLPGRITAIGDGAFTGCINLTSVTFEASGSALTVGNDAFANCAALTQITLPSYTSKLGDGAFYATPLTSFTVPADLQSIGAQAFMYTNLTAITVPSGVTEIGDGAFAYSKLNSVTFEEGSAALVLGGPTDIDISYHFESDDYTTKKNSKLFPEDYIGVDAIGVFTGTALKTVNLPARLTQIGAFAFYRVASLTSVTVSDQSQLTVIGDAAFYGSGVAAIGLDKTAVTTVGDFAFTETHLTSVSLPSTVTVIEKYAFADIGQISGTGFKGSLTKVEFASGGTEKLTVKGNAFRNSAFTEITFPARLESCADPVLVGSADPSYALQIKSFYLVVEGNAALEAVHVESGCAKYASIDGVLYEKNESGEAVTLIYCPPAKKGTLTVPKTVTHVENRAFFLSQLSSVTFENYASGDRNFGKAILEIGNAANSSSYMASYAVFGGTVGRGGAVTAHSILSGYNAAVSIQVRNTASPSTSKIAQISFPSHLKTLGSYAIYNLSTNGLTVTFAPDTSPIELYEKAIYSNYAIVADRFSEEDTFVGLTALHLPAVKSLANDSWYASTLGSNMALTTVTFGEGSTVKILPDSLFSGCSALTSVAIPASVTQIDARCFQGCTALTNITFAEGSQLVSIGSAAFSRTGLTEFVFPDGVTSVGEKVFDGCKVLTKVTLGAGMTGTLAYDPNGTSSTIFRGCTSIREFAVAKNHPTLSVEDGVLYDIAKSIVLAFPPAKDSAGYTIPATVKEIYDYAFYGYKGSSIVLPDSLTRIGYGAFLRSSLESVLIPASVKEIDGYAFSAESMSYAHLTEVTFAPNSQLTTIGRDAFAYSLMTSVDLPDNVTSIGRMAFGNTRSLKTVTLPAALKTIGDMAFYYDSGLTEVTFQSQLETIGYQAFVGCASLVRADLPASLTSIGLSAFSGCKKLEAVTFGEGSRLTSVEYQAFMNCSSLKELIFPDGLSELGYQIFSGCSSLETVDLSGTTIPSLTAYVSSSGKCTGFFEGCAKLKTVLLPETLETIDYNAFKGCSALESISIPATVSALRDNAFDGCTSLASATFSGNSVLTELGAAAFRGTAALRTAALPDGITSIGESIFEGSGLTSVTLPAGLNTISTSAFRGCVNLTEIVIPATVTDIGDKAFADCTNLETVEMSEGVEYLGADAFGNCAKIREILIPASVMRMGGNPFSNCLGLTNFGLAAGNDSFVIDAAGVLYDANMRTIIFYPSYVTTEVYEMPGTVFELSASAFAGSQLKRITISDNIKAIPAGCFRNSALLESVTIPASVTEIGNEAFMGCAKLNNVVIPVSCASIGNSVFEDCTSLTSFDFGSRNIELRVGTALFRGCTALENILLPDGLTALPAYMFANTGVKSVVIPDSVQDLSGDGLFMGCAKLTDIQLPEGYSGTLGTKAFYGCTVLTKMTLPDGMTGLGNEAFKNCTSLASVGFGSGLNDLGMNSFENCTSLTEVDLSGSDVWALGNEVFKNCTALETLVLGSDCYDLGCNTFEGCAAIKGSVTLPYCWLYGGFFKGCTGISEVHISGWDWFESYGSDGEVAGNFDGWTASQKVIFDESSYEDLVDDFFSDSVGDNLMVGSAARVFDCDGNEIIYEAGTGILVRVVDADGNTVYEP